MTPGRYKLVWEPAPKNGIPSTVFHTEGELTREVLLIRLRELPDGAWARITDSDHNQLFSYFAADFEEGAL